MIDFAKIRLRGRGHRRYRRDLRTHPLLRWTQAHHAVDHPPQGCTTVASWRVWTFYANDREVIEIRGSFHKFYHGGANWQDFTHAQFKEAVDTFCETFQVFHGALHFLNLEVGVNIIPLIPTRDLLERVLFHRNARPVRMDPGQGITIKHPGHFRYKIYDKAFEFGLPGELMRVEIHVDRMAILNRIGVTTASDLLDPACWGRLRTFLLGKVAELFIVEDDIAPGRVTRPQRDLLAKAGRWEYWKGLSPNKRHRKRAKVERLWRLHHHPTLKGDLLARIAAKVAALTTDKAEGGMFDATRAHALTNTRVIHHPITPSQRQEQQDTSNGVRRCLSCEPQWASYSKVERSSNSEGANEPAAQAAPPGTTACGPFSASNANPCCSITIRSWRRKLCAEMQMPRPRPAGTGIMDPITTVELRLRPAPPWRHAIP